jgi:hypothetical protein
MQWFYAETTPTGVAELQAQKISLYPNPSTGIFNFSAQTEKEVMILITDNTGKTVLASRTSGGRIDLRALPNGIYGLRLLGDYGLKAASRISILR